MLGIVKALPDFLLKTDFKVLVKIRLFFLPTNAHQQLTLYVLPWKEAMLERGPYSFHVTLCELEPTVTAVSQNSGVESCMKRAVLSSASLKLTRMG